MTGKPGDFGPLPADYTPPPPPVDFTPSQDPLPQGYVAPPPSPGDFGLHLGYVPPSEIPGYVPPGEVPPPPALSERALAARNESETVPGSLRS